MSGWNPFKQPENDPGDGWRDYLATNLLDAMESLDPREFNTGDWYYVTINWCKEHSTGRIKPNRTMNDGNDKQSKTDDKTP